jgi:hypothetical protein
LNIIQEYFQTAVYPTVIQIESEAPDFQRLPTAFVPAGIDAGDQLLQNVIVYDNRVRLKTSKLLRSSVGSTDFAVIAPL